MFKSFDYENTFNGLLNRLIKRFNNFVFNLWCKTRKAKWLDQGLCLNFWLSVDNYFSHFL